MASEGETESSTFENIKFSSAAAPAVEFNVFPYSAYTRRQLRALYAVGVRHVRYYEETLYGKTEETLPAPSSSRSPTNSASNGARSRPGRSGASTCTISSKSRLEADGELSVRLARGLSVEGQISGSRIRDQLSLPARDATDEEILLRLRQLQSGYEFSFSVSLTYTFGSIFSSVVNPRFGQ